MKSAVAAAFILALATGAHAQQRHHSAPPPPPAPVVPRVLSTGGVTTLPPPPPPSPFAARPGTYAPHYNEPAHRQHGHENYGSYYGGGFIGIGDFVPGPADATPPASFEQRPPVATPEPPRAPEPVPEPPPIAASHGPDLFYVIPGCYAGNRPPSPSRLPKGCDIARMRTTPVR